MATAATATKPVPPPAAASPAAKPLKTLREALPKKFGPSSLYPLGQDYEILAVTVPDDWSFEEVMKPIAWGNVARIVARNPLSQSRDKVGSLIYASGSQFSAWLRINAVKFDGMGGACGLDVICIGPTVDLKTGKACPVDVKTGLAWVDPPKPEAE